jgi:hypothetical protein
MARFERCIGFEVVQSGYRCLLPVVVVWIRNVLLICVPVFLVQISALVVRLPIYIILRIPALHPRRMREGCIMHTVAPDNMVVLVIDCGSWGPRTWGPVSGTREVA